MNNFSLSSYARKSALKHGLGVVFAACVCAATAQVTSSPVEGDAALATVFNGSQRSATNRARDAVRHPAETLGFFGLKPDQTVIEIAPGGGWYTEILAPYLRGKGRFYVALDAVSDNKPATRKALDRFKARFTTDPALYGQVNVGTLPTGSSFTDIQPPGGADMVLTFRNIHNWIADGYLDETLRAFYTVLKPGGVLGVEEHRAVPGTSLERIIASGYVPEQFLIDHARAAGFELAAHSELNANPRDTKVHLEGVWALPPTLADGDVDRAKYLVIGESDRMTLRFVKPRQ